VNSLSHSLSHMRGPWRSTFHMTAFDCLLETTYHTPLPRLPPLAFSSSSKTTLYLPVSIVNPLVRTSLHTSDRTSWTLTPSPTIGKMMRFLRKPLRQSQQKTAKQLPVPRRQPSPPRRKSLPHPSVSATTLTTARTVALLPRSQVHFDRSTLSMRSIPRIPRIRAKMPATPSTLLQANTPIPPRRSRHRRP
jgi:hypothetical protein